MSELSNYIQDLIDNITPEKARDSFDKYIESHPTPPGIEVHIPLNGDEDISKCPRCNALIDRHPQPSLHLSSTFYECDTEVIEFISNNCEIFINRIGYKCIDNVSNYNRRSNGIETMV